MFKGIHVLVNWVSIGSGNCFVAYSAPSRHLNQCWLIAIGPLGTNLSEIPIKIQVFIHENVFECVGCEMAAILSREDELTKIQSPVFEILSLHSQRNFTRATTALLQSKQFTRWPDKISPSLKAFRFALELSDCTEIWQGWRLGSAPVVLSWKMCHVNDTII